MNELESFYAALVLGHHEGPAQAALESLLRSLPLRESTKLHLCSQDPARLFVYRTLARSTLQRAIGSSMPRAKARLGEDFAPLFSEFLASQKLHSRCLRDLAAPFISFGREHCPSTPRYIWDLAEFESVRILVAAHPENRHDSADGTSPELELTRGLLFVESSCLLSFDHAVHLLPDDESYRTLPRAQPTRLFAFRSSSHEVLFLELSPLAFCILTKLLAGCALGEAVSKSCDELSVALDEAVLAGTAKILSDLAAQGALLRPSGRA